MTKILIDREVLVQALDAMKKGFWTGLEHRRYLDAMAALDTIIDEPSEPKAEYVPCYSKSIFTYPEGTPGAPRYCPALKRTCTTCTHTCPPLQEGQT